MKLYGLKNCDTCRKALRALEAAGIGVVFHDVRADGLEAAEIKIWLRTIPADTLVNKRSTTWKTLSDADKQAAADPATVPRLLADHPTLVKRPVIVKGDAVFVGWTDDMVSALSI